MFIFSYFNTTTCRSSERQSSMKPNARKQSTFFRKKSINWYIFSLLSSLKYLPLVSQCTKYNISFTPFVDLWKTKNFGFLALSNIYYYGSSRQRMSPVYWYTSYISETNITNYIYTRIQETSKNSNPKLKDDSCFINFDNITEE